ncbi:uncharacterized protein C13orf42 homolog [Bufo gargarizans]|uniref:uncharacterized protein C13orf42 homolog n=1 Tax=Bufo gargarizans TaxID=30331 RepID=UPI001CF23932|nr:uncharacterized protein C13orf42 homolog [Bufo gargarizans]
MLRKIQSALHPNSCSRDLTEGSTTHNGSLSPVRLVRSTSMYVVGEGKQTLAESLKKYKSTTNIEMSGCCYYKDEDSAWLFAKTQDFLQYLQDLLALRKKYLASIHNLRCMTGTSDYLPISTKSTKAEKKSSQETRDVKVLKDNEKQNPNSDIMDAIAYFDSVIAELDTERRIRTAPSNFKHADVDFDVATSSREHSLHSNWILRAPRRSTEEVLRTSIYSQSWRSSMGNTSFKRIERYPIYLPKAVEGAFNTLKFKPRPKVK